MAVKQQKVLSAFQEANKRAAEELQVLNRVVARRCARMNTSAKAKPSAAKKRNLFAELSEGLDALAETRQGRRTLRTNRVEFKPAPALTPKQLIAIRKRLKLSRPLFAAYLRTNVRTLENWEQGRAKPNAQAALLISLVKHYPDTVERLAAI